MRTGAGWAIILSVVFSTTATAQNTQREFDFVRYLMAKKNFDEAAYALDALLVKPLTTTQQDSANYFLGNVFYNQQNLAASIAHFDLVSEALPRLKSEAVFFSAFNHAYLGNRLEAQQRLAGFQTTDSLQTELKLFHLAGLALLTRDLADYDSLTAHFGESYYLLEQQRKNLREHHQRIVDQPRKSPLVAAALSAVLPGAGRFYAGNKGQGLYTFLIASIVGLQAWEGYEKAGPRSFRFIAYGTLFCSLYIGTIWGSAFSVKFRKDQLNETIDQQILFDMHIPIRTLFH